MKLRKILAAVVAGTLAAGAMMTLAGAAEKTAWSVSFDETTYVFTAPASAAVTSAASANVSEWTSSIGSFGTADINVPAGPSSTLAPITSHSIEVDKTNLTIVSGKSITEFKFAVGGNVYSYDYSKTNSSDISYNLDNVINGLRAAQFAALESGSSHKLVITFNKAFTGSEVTLTVDGAEKKVAVSGFKAELPLVYNKSYGEFDVQTVAFTPAAGSVVSVVLAYNDTASTTDPSGTPSGSGEDITVNPDVSGTPSGGASGGVGGTGNENPKNGVMFAIIPAIVSGAAAIVSKKR